MRKITLSLLIILVAGAAFAQPPGSGPWRGDRDFNRPPKEMIEGFRLFKLTEELELTESQTAKIYPLLAEMNKEREAHHEALQEEMKKLRDLLDEKKVDERKAAKLAMEIHDMHLEILEGQHAMQSKLLELLDDTQKAKYMLFDQDFNRKMRQVRERMHDRFDDGGSGPRGYRPGGPGWK